MGCGALLIAALLDYVAKPCGSDSAWSEAVNRRWPSSNASYNAVKKSRRKRRDSTRTGRKNLGRPVGRPRSGKLPIAVARAVQQQFGRCVRAGQPSQGGSQFPRVQADRGREGERLVGRPPEGREGLAGWEVPSRQAARRQTGRTGGERVHAVYRLAAQDCARIVRPLLTLHVDVAGEPGDGRLPRNRRERIGSISARSGFPPRRCDGDVIPDEAFITAAGRTSFVKREAASG